MASLVASVLVVSAALSLVTAIGSPSERRTA
jgi:hypothetical protein